MSFQTDSLNKGDRIHFMGIGGVSMSGLAEIMIHRGYTVTGSDRVESKLTKKLEMLGAKIFYSQISENISADIDLLVYTAAIKDTNPELLKAKQSCIKTIERAEFLGALMQEYSCSICAAGTHGKTTTTSMLTYLFMEANTDPTVTVGGELDILSGNFRIGNSKYFIIESCEYHRSFLWFNPKISIISNVEEDHLDYFNDLNDIVNAFGDFAALTDKDGCVIVRGDDKNAIMAIQRDDIVAKIITFAIDNNENIDYYAQNLVYNQGYSEFDCYYRNQFVAHIKLNVPGEHNVYNALSSIAAGVFCGINPDIIAVGLSKFYGTKRRFERKGNCNGAVIIDDYAHHPTEISATLAVAKKFNAKEIYCVFQPHTYTRTRALFEDFAQCFKECDHVILTDIFSAREENDGSISSEMLCKRMKEIGIDAVFISSFNEIEHHLRKNLHPEDMVFTIGAGDIYKIGENIAE